MSETPLPDVSAERSTTDERPGVGVKMGSPNLEFNVWIPDTQLGRLETVRQARWDDRGSVQLGQVAGAPAWWCVDPDEQVLSILVGHDDETWDVCARWPLATLDAIIAEVSSCREAAGGV